MQPAQLLILRVPQITPGFELSSTLPSKHDGKALGGLIVAVPHSGTVQDHAMVEKPPIVILVGLELVEQVIEFLHVPEADFEKRIDILPTEVAEEMRKIMVLLLDAEEIEDHPTVAVTQHVGYAPRGVRPKGHRDDIEHGVDLLIHIGRSKWTDKATQLGGLNSLIKETHFLEFKFGLAQSGEIFVEGLAVLNPGFSLKSLGIR